MENHHLHSFRDAFRDASTCLKTMRRFNEQLVPTRPSTAIVRMASGHAGLKGTSFKGTHTMGQKHMRMTTRCEVIQLTRAIDKSTNINKLNGPSKSIP